MKPTNNFSLRSAFPWLLVIAMLAMWAGDTGADGKRPILRSIVGFVVKWVLVPVVLDEPKHESVADADAENKYRDAFQEHLSHNQEPTRAVGVDGEPVIDHGHGW